MKEEFRQALNNNYYISNALYQEVLMNDKNLIPNNFDIDEYNNKVLDKLTIEYQDYFNHLYDGISDIKLDNDQIRAILADEKYALIVAGAGTGKTTTMASKVKYLVDIKKVNPNRILVMSYARKATEELINRINVDFNTSAQICTFHSLGYKYIRSIFVDRKCIVMDINKRKEIFLSFFKELFMDKETIKEIIDKFDSLRSMYKFLFSNYFLSNFEDYETYDQFFDDYITMKLEEAKMIGVEELLSDWINKQLKRDENITTIKGDYVKSAGEAVIANFLFTHGIDYSYEDPYDVLMEDNMIYKPDFTVNYGGKKIYIEYFGMDDPSYNRIKRKKIRYHQSHHNKFIGIDRMSLDKIVEELDDNLQQYGIIYNELDTESIYKQILRLNPIAPVYPFEKFLNECVSYIKESPYRDKREEVIHNYLNKLEDVEFNTISVQARYILKYYNFYSKVQFGGEDYYFDYDDLLYYANKYINNLTTNVFKYDYIIIDEYQDISSARYNLLRNTALKNNSKVFAVGDDWQTIFSFSGSRIEYFIYFSKYFKDAKLFTINQTYRNSQELINYSSEFIMRNHYQIPKKLISSKHLNKPIIIKEFNRNIDNPEAEIDCLKETLKEIHHAHPNYKILVLSRYNKFIRLVLNNSNFIDGIDTKVIYIDDEDKIKFDLMTIHKSKGLTYDVVIVIGLSKSFPGDKNGISWVEELFKNKIMEEGLPYPEERRVFYVALTRTKNEVILLCDQNDYECSAFVSEIRNIINEKSSS